MRPGINVTISTIPPQRSAPTDTGVWFVAGLTEKGPADKPLLIQSMADYTRVLGARVSYGLLYDALDLFFREGGNRAYVMRVVGPAAAKASKVLNDAGAAATLTVRALGPGPYGNTQLKIAVLTPLVSGFRLQVSDGNNVVLETSPDLAAKADAFQWAQSSQYIELVDGASALNPAVIAAAFLTGGSDDQGSITETHWKAAIDRATSGWGPGQVSYPGRSTAQSALDLLSHAAAMNRTAILDLADTPTQATLLAAAAAARAAGNGHYGGAFAGWLLCPGLTSGTTRLIPPSALVAGKIAQVDASDGPNQPAAGDLGVSSYATDVSQVYDDATRQTLNDNGVNVIRLYIGEPTIYGWRSLASPATETVWKSLGHQRLIMAITALASAAMDRYMFKTIDGQGRLQGSVSGALSAICLPFYESGDLYGSSPDQAFRVDTGDTVNTPITLANDELRASIQLRPSPFAEMVTINIIKTPITEEVS